MKFENDVDLLRETFIRESNAGITSTLDLEKACFSSFAILLLDVIVVQGSSTSKIRFLL
jgi:hypothetical protein